MPKRKKTAKLSVTDLALEATRRCNMKCVHCMRGDAEDLDMPKRLIENIFSAVSEIRTLTFTGGEPSLVPGLMKHALSMAKKYQVRVFEVYIATNGKEVSEEFLAACRAWHMKCLSDAAPYHEEYLDAGQIRNIVRTRNAYEPAGLFLDISMDLYHEDIPKENVLRLCTLPNIRMDKYRDPDENDSWVLHVGRAYWNGMGPDDVESNRPWAYGESADIMSIDRDPETGALSYDGMLYVNAEGKILKYCDYPYDDQDEHVMGCILTDEPDRSWAERLYGAHEHDGDPADRTDG